MVLVLAFGFLLGFLFRPHYDEYKSAKKRKQEKAKNERPEPKA